MREWDVTVEVRIEDVLVPLEELADELVDALSSSDGVVSIVDGTLFIAATVEVPDYAAAVNEALGVITNAFEKLDLFIAPEQIVGVEARTADATNALVDEPTYPPMVGVAEVAEILDVSKQRVFELRESGRLPTPLTELRAGPVWPKPAIERWLEGWERKPGRPKRAANGE